MIFGFITLVLLLAAWIAALWLLIAPDFTQLSLLQLAAIHLGPPLLLWGVWMTWRRIRKNKADSIAAEQEKLAEKERQEKAEAARQKHEAELLHLRYGCDCRALAMAQVMSAEDDDEPLVPEGEGISLSTAGKIEEEDEDEDVGERSSEQALLEHLRPGIEEALTSIYLACPAAAVFPIYISPPAELSGKDVIASLRQTRVELALELGLPFKAESEFNRVLFLPTADSVAGSIIGLFEANPELHAAIILAFDSPAKRSQTQELEEDWEQSAVQAKQRQLHGQPGQGVVALFMTREQLPEMLGTAPRNTGQYDALIPYWEKAPAATGSAAYFEHLSEDDREALQSAPVLARIHRATGIQLGTKQLRSMEMARVIEGLLKQAQICAALIEPPIESPEPSAKGSAATATDSSKVKAADCHWLVHNAGGVDHAGLRLSALGVAMLSQAIELDPIAEATNVTIKAGDLGQARGAAMLALTIARAASGGAAALCAEFTGNADNAGITLSFAVAPQGEA